MMISTRGRYALRVLVDLAEHSGEGLVPMKEIARRQGISLKYLEQIVPSLTKKGYLEGVHGKGGGYRLGKAPEECKVGDILRLTEGDLAPVACLEKGARPCERAYACKTYPMWMAFQRIVENFFDQITLADIVNTDMTDFYSI